MNLKEIAQEFAGRTGLPVPTFVIGNTDAQVLQIKGLLNEYLDDLTTRKAWERSTIECTFTTVAAESQGPIDTLCPYGFQGIILETTFDRTQRLPIYGGVSPQEWQARKAFNITGPLYQFRLRGGELLCIPPPPAGHTFAFEYMSNFFVVNNDVSPTDTALYRQYWAKDTDTCQIDNGLPVAYLRWAWKKEKGLEYAEDFSKYERMVATMLSRDAAAKPVTLDSEGKQLRPGIFIPAGNWLQP